MTLAGGKAVGPLLATLCSGGAALGSPARGTSIRYTFFSQASTSVAEGACLHPVKGWLKHMTSQLSKPVEHIDKAAGSPAAVLARPFSDCSQAAFQE